MERSTKIGIVFAAVVVVVLIIVAVSYSKENFSSKIPSQPKPKVPTPECQQMIKLNLKQCDDKNTQLQKQIQILRSVNETLKNKLDVYLMPNPVIESVSGNVIFGGQINGQSFTNLIISGKNFGNQNDYDIKVQEIDGAISTRDGVVTSGSDINRFVVNYTDNNINLQIPDNFPQSRYISVQLINKNIPNKVSNIAGNRTQVSSEQPNVNPENPNVPSWSD